MLFPPGLDTFNNDLVHRTEVTALDLLLNESLCLRSACELSGPPSENRRISIARTRCGKCSCLCFQFTVVFPSWVSRHHQPADSVPAPKKPLPDGCGSVKTKARRSVRKCSALRTERIR